MLNKEHLVQELEQALLDRRSKLIEMRDSIQRTSDAPGALQMVAKLLHMGLRMMMYVKALEHPDFNDDSAVSEVREYCDLVDQLYNKGLED